MVGELEVLGIVVARLRQVGVEFMLTGSFALAYYATPRMTRDIDLVVALDERCVDPVAQAFAPDFYVDADAVRDAVASERLFNLMHLASGVKVDCIVRKDEEYRRLEFERRSEIRMGDVVLPIVSREDLILSKLVWGRDSGSEMQRRDVQALVDASLDRAYLRRWASHLGVARALEEVLG